MPFCPSLEPCAKLTPPQVAISVPRTQRGGRSSPFGGSYRRGSRKTRFIVHSSSAAEAKPTNGDTSSPSPASPALTQFTPLSPLPVSRLLAMPTPRIEPISVWELDTGSPRYHVQRFHITPASSNDSTMIRAAL